MHGISTRRIVTLVLVGALVLSAGCSGIGIGESDTDTTDSADAPATEEPTEGSDATPTTSDGSNSNDEETTGAETSESDSGDAGDGHDHGGDGDDESSGSDDNDNEGAEETEDGSDGNGGELTRTTAEANGRMLIAVDGERLDLGARDESGDKFRMEEGDVDNWLSAEEVTLAEALTYFNITAENSQLTVDGEQFSEVNEGTTITYRVDEEPVDPESYTLTNYHEIWIVVETADTDVTSPGEYISESEYHAHGDMTFIVDDHEVVFTEEFYQENNHKHFHFEGGHDYWHAHTWSITVEDALSATPGINADGDTIYYNGTSTDGGTSYDDSDAGTSITVRVNGESVDPSEYILKDGDDVYVEIASEQGS